VGEHRGFKFGGQDSHSKSQRMDDKTFLNGAKSRHMTHFKFLLPLKYLWNAANAKGFKFCTLVGQVKYYGLYRMTQIPMTLSELEGHFCRYD